MESMLKKIQPQQAPVGAVSSVCVYELADGQSFFAPTRLVEHVLQCGRISAPVATLAQPGEALTALHASLECADR